MPKARRKSTRDNLREDISLAIATETNPNKLRALFNKAKRQIRYTQQVADLHRKYLDLTLPKLRKNDEAIIDLRDCWIESTIRLRKNMSARMKKALLSKGYLKSMIDQINTTGIGSKKYVELEKIKSVAFTAEYIVFTFFSDYLTSEQQMEIAMLLEDSACVCSRHHFLICASSKNLNLIKY